MDKKRNGNGHKSFEKWKYSEIQKNFGVRKLTAHPTLDEWLKAAEPPSELERTMLVARAKNPDKALLHRLYIIGRLWFFVVLAQEGYAVSRGFDATTDDLFTIAAILKKQKNEIENNFRQVDS